MVDGDQNIETGRLGRVEETAILQSGEFGEAGGMAIVSRKQKAQMLVDTVVEQEANQARASRSCLASSRASTAKVRETVGNPDRKSSRVSPPSR